MVMKCCLLNSCGSLISPPLSPLPAPAILSSMAGGNYLLPGLSLMSPTYSPHGAEGSLYSTVMVPILPGLCLAACEALSLQHCQPTALPLTLVASETLAFLQGQEGTRFLTRSHELTWSTPHLEHPSPGASLVLMPGHRRVSSVQAAGDSSSRVMASENQRLLAHSALTSWGLREREAL